jgi:hypothetical protein
MSNILILLLILLQVADAALTVKVLSKGGRELNPIMAKLMNALGVNAALVLSKTILVVIVIVVEPEFWLLCMLNIVYLAVCVNNWRESKKGSKKVL